MIMIIIIVGPDHFLITNMIYVSIRSETDMNLSARKATLHVDDYLDLLNLAAQLGDIKWQKEIIRKLEYMRFTVTK